MPDYKYERFTLRDIYFTLLPQIEVGSRSWVTKSRDIELEVITKKALLVPFQYRERRPREIQRVLPISTLIENHLGAETTEVTGFVVIQGKQVQTNVTSLRSLCYLLPEGETRC